MIGKCETCNGTGHAGYEPCTDCFATGEVPGGSTPEEFDRAREEWLQKRSPESPIRQHLREITEPELHPINLETIESGAES